MATSYVILYKANPEDSYELLPAPVDAASATAAVRTAAGEAQQPGIYAAIPARSFEPVKIEFEAQPRVKVVKT